jgi:hypothetical protein
MYGFHLMNNLVLQFGGDAVFDRGKPFRQLALRVRPEK